MSAPARRAALASPLDPSGAFLVPALGAALLAWLITAAEGASQAHGWLTAGGPLLLLAGLHARLSPFAHDPLRLSELPRPHPPRRHLAAALGRWHGGHLATSLLGAAALAGAALARPEGSFGRDHAALVAAWLWLCVLAAAAEPLATAAAVWFGRPAAAGSELRRLQLALSGGLAAPEVAAWLWAPAMAVAMAAVGALPGQLALEAYAAGHRLPPLLLHAAWVLPGALWAARLAVARPCYGAGLWQAVPWLHQVTRSLSGRDLPRATPGLARLFRDPVGRLVAAHAWRRTPVAAVRLYGVLPVAAAAQLIAPPHPLAPRLALALVAAALWIMPTLRALGDPALARLLAPLPPRRLPARVTGVLLGPAALPLLAAALRLLLP